MKKLLFVLLVLLCLPLPARAVEEAPQISAQSAVVMDAGSGKVLFEQDADSPRLIASITKIMTALVVLENRDPEEEVEILRQYTLTEGSSMYLREGEKLTVRELLYGLLLHSGNDAATALACHTAGSEADFARLMNEKAAQLGMENSSFENPHGLDGEKHFSSARDMAKLTAAALEQPLFCEIVSTKEISLAGRSFTNHNKLLWNCAGVIGVKTGYTKAAGRTLVSACTRKGTTLICVTLCDGDDWNDHSRLYDWAFSAYSRQNVALAGASFGEVPLISGGRTAVTVAAGKNLSLLLPEGAQVRLETRLPDFAYAPVTAGEKAGELVALLGEEELARVPLVYAQSVSKNQAERLSAWDKLKNAWYLANKYAILPLYGGF